MGLRRMRGYARSPLDLMAAFTSMMTRSLFEAYPGLRCGVLEAGSNWITARLDRPDHKAEIKHCRLKYSEGGCFIFENVHHVGLLLLFAMRRRGLDGALR